jgi:hypothetical protein
MNTEPSFTIRFPEDPKKSRKNVDFSTFIAAMNRELFKFGIPPIEGAPFDDAVSDETDRVRIEYGNGFTVADIVRTHLEQLPTPIERKQVMDEYLETEETSLGELEARLRSEDAALKAAHGSMVAALTATCQTTRDCVERGHLAFQGGQWSELIPKEYSLSQAIGLFDSAKREGLHFIINPDDLPLNKSVSEFAEYSRAFARVAMAHGLEPCDGLDELEAIKDEYYSTGVTVDAAVQAAKMNYASAEEMKEHFEAAIARRGKTAEEVMEQFVKPIELAFTEKEWRACTAIDRGLRFQVLESEIPRYAKGTPLENREILLLRSDDWPRQDTLGKILAEIDQHRNYLFGTLGFELGEEFLGAGRQMLDRGMKTVPTEEIYLSGVSRAVAERVSAPGKPYISRPEGYYEAALCTRDGTKLFDLSESATNILRKQGIRFKELQPMNDAPLPAAGRASVKGKSL